MTASPICFACGREILDRETLVVPIQAWFEVIRGDPATHFAHMSHFENPKETA